MREEEAEHPHDGVKEGAEVAASEVPRAQSDEEEDDDKIPLSYRILKRPRSSPLEEGTSSPGSAAGLKTSSADHVVAQPLRFVPSKKLWMGWNLQPTADATR